MAFVFHLQKDFYVVQNNADVFCCFFQIHSISFASILTVFVFVFLQKDFDTFHESFFEAFLCFFDNTSLTFYLGKKLFY